MSCMDTFCFSAFDSSLRIESSSPHSKCLHGQEKLCIIQFLLLFQQKKENYTGLQQYKNLTI